VQQSRFGTHGISTARARSLSSGGASIAIFATAWARSAAAASAATWGRVDESWLTCGETPMMPVRDPLPSRRLVK
jgi:hypothetical protein